MSISPSETESAVDPQRPWLGLSSFTEETQSYFYGRDDEVAELARRVQRKLLTVLFGQSGLGKTSILRAGLVPKLRPEGYCPIYVRLDHSQDSASLAEQIKQAVDRASEAVGTWSRPGVAQAGESLWEFFHHRDDALTAPDGRTLTPLLIFDQFEEIFTLAQTDDAGRARAQVFLRELSDLVENRAPAVIEDDEEVAGRFDFARADYRLLIALREDYLAHLEGLREQMPSVTQNRVRLTRMAGGPALEAVLKPGAGLVDDDVARQVVRFVSGAHDLATAEVEPSLLSLVCRELNEMRLAQGEAVISARLLAGSRETILNEFYERSLADQPDGVRRFIEDVLLTDSGFRESVAEERVRKAFAEAGAPEAVVQLVDQRLLRIEERLDVRRVELTHDVLCGVVSASRDSRHEREARAAAERRAAETEAREASTRRAMWRARMVALGAAVLCVIAIGSAIFGYRSMQRAQAAQARADAARVQAERFATFMTSQMRPALEQYGRVTLLEQLLEQTAAYYRALPLEMRDLDTDRSEAEALGMLATLHYLMSDDEGAADYLRACLALREKVQLAAPDDAENTAKLILSQSKVDLNAADGDSRAELESRIAENYTRLKAVAGEHPENLQILHAQAELAEIYARFLLFWEENPEDSLAMAIEGRALWREIIAREPDNLWNRSFYVRAVLLQATVLFSSSQEDQAVQVVQEAVDYAEEAVQHDPGNLTLLEAAAEAAQNLAWWLGQTDQQRAAQAELIARARYQTLMELEPTNPSHRRGFIAAHDMECWARLAEGRWAEAAQAFHRFAALNDTLPLEQGGYDSIRARLNEGRMKAELGQVDDVRALIDEAETRLKNFFPDFDRLHIWFEIEAVKVLRVVHDWAGAERRARGVLSEIREELGQAENEDTPRVFQAQAQMLLGEALLRQGRAPEAAGQLNEAVVAFQETPPTLFNLMQERAVDHAHAWELQAEALAATGDRARARSILERLLEDRLRNLSVNYNWYYTQGSAARTFVRLAALHDATKPDEADERTELLDRAAVMLSEQQKRAPLGVNDTELLAKITALRTEGN